MCHAPAKLLLFLILQCILTALFDLLLAVTVIEIGPLTIRREDFIALKVGARTRSLATVTATFLATASASFHPSQDILLASRSPIQRAKLLNS